MLFDSVGRARVFPSFVLSLNLSSPSLFPLHPLFARSLSRSPGRPPRQRSIDLQLPMVHQDLDHPLPQQGRHLPREAQDPPTYRAVLLRLQRAARRLPSGEGVFPEEVSEAQQVDEQGGLLPVSRTDRSRFLFLRRVRADRIGTAFTLQLHLRRRHQHAEGGDGRCGRVRPRPPLPSCFLFPLLLSFVVLLSRSQTLPFYLLAPSIIVRRSLTEMAVI